MKDINDIQEKKGRIWAYRTTRHRDLKERGSYLPLLLSIYTSIYLLSVV
jgi:hypothetical protein